MVVTFSCLNLQLILSIWVHLQVFALNHHLSFSFVSTIVSTPEICFVIGTMEEFTRKAKQIVRFIYLFFCFHRVEYKQLGKLRGILPNVPFVGLTATATEKYAFSTFVQGCKLILFFWSFYGLFCGGHSFYVTYRCCTFWVKTSSSYLRNRYVKLQIDYNDNFLWEHWKLLKGVVQHHIPIIHAVTNSMPKELDLIQSIFFFAQIWCSLNIGTSLL